MSAYTTESEAEDAQRSACEDHGAHGSCPLCEPHAIDDFHVRCAAPGCDHPRDPVCLSDCCGEECDGVFMGDGTTENCDNPWAHADCVEVNRGQVPLRRFAVMSVAKGPRCTGICGRRVSKYRVPICPWCTRVLCLKCVCPGMCAERVGAKERDVAK